MPDEATLLERIRQCDTAALAQVYDDYYDRMYRYIYGYVGQVGAAEDLTANVFFRLLRAVRDGNSPRRNLSASFLFPVPVETQIASPPWRNFA